ncbi:hypothetical protein ABZX77_30350, partial [Streptomyces sp. NPDC004237]
ESPISPTNPSRPGLCGHQRQERSKEPAGVRVNGALDHYRAAPPAAVAGLIAVQASRAGKLAEAYEAWYITPSGYEIAYGPDGTVLGIRLDVPVLMKRPVRAAARPRLTDEQTALLRQVLDLEAVRVAESLLEIPGDTAS